MPQHVLQKHDMQSRKFFMSRCLRRNVCVYSGCLLLQRFDVWWEYDSTTTNRNLQQFSLAHRNAKWNSFLILVSIWKYNTCLPTPKNYRKSWRFDKTDFPWNYIIQTLHSPFEDERHFESTLDAEKCTSVEDSCRCVQRKGTSSLAILL